jgi:multicomponent Na+:H+ antiporter subunit D
MTIRTGDISAMVTDMPLGLPLDLSVIGAPWNLPPSMIFFAGAILLLLAPRGWIRTLILLVTPAIGAINILSLGAGDMWDVQIGNLELALYHADRLSLLFGYIFHVAAFFAVIYGLHVKDKVQQFASLAYPGAALGAVFAGDLLTLFIFWELLALTSVLLIWARRSDRSPGAGMRYLAINVVSGLLLLSGALIMKSQTGSFEFGFIGLGGLASWLIFLSFGIKCAFPLLHNWVTDGYPEATPLGTVLLSAFTTKVAVYALARAYPGAEILIWIGALMTFFPIFFAVIENDLRRVLAYSMINQIGFMVIGIGIGTNLALNGAVSHAFNDILFKGLLMMSMGVVLHMTGKIKGSELGGLYKTMPVTTILCIVGAASISAFPLFAGFVSKSMIVLAAIEEGYTFVWMVMLFASAGVFHHAGIKIPYFAFFAHDSGIRVRKPVPAGMMLAMIMAAGACIYVGSSPGLLYSLLPWELHYEAYTLTHVITQTQILFLSAIAFGWLMMVGLYPPELKSTNLDADWVYRAAGPRLVRWLSGQIGYVNEAVRTGTRDQLNAMMEFLNEQAGPQGVLSRAWPVGSSAVWVLLMLVAVIAFILI